VRVNLGNGAPVTEYIDVAALFRRVIHRKWLVLASTAVLAVPALVYGLTAVEWYEARVVLVPAGAKPATAGLGQLGGLASLAGISLQSGGEGQLGLETLRSRQSAEEFIVSEGIEADLRQFSAVSGDANPRYVAAEYFVNSVRSVVEDKKSGVVQITMRWTDPGIAAKWANQYVKTVNSKLQLSALREAEARVDFLKAELQQSELSTLQVGVGALIESEIQKIVLIKSNPDYAYRVVDQATPPIHRVWPRRSMILAFGVALGGLLGVLLAVLFPRRPEGE
jgi:uncharacterized protein involved in exopolysaccharide biosynthesis